ncbi:hypothetical protein E1B28_013666 [Marasmius oreades]|uniref:Ras GEF n=1 Tax=Marasmius oreades TaxID=181124 RepID=A0A9P7RQA8_9AGAR|nr:uncharacterized protein E1B28_013666 [Marasmius oreades]KAG7087720.1 hypothetical protein E1B28_013666 [Marasmius oreades]
MPSQQEKEPLLPPPSTAQPSSSPPKLLPIPAPSTTTSKASFTYPENEEAGSSISTGLPPEIASADISIAPDGSFVETSSSAAALELKKRYDNHFGVNPPSVRSPYVITAFINQHGKRMFRIGHKDMSAPAAAGYFVEDQIINRASSSFSHRHVSPSTPSAGTHRSSRSRRQSRLSAFLTSNPKKNKLRKPRSNPDMQQQQQTTTSPKRVTGAIPSHSTMPSRRFAGGRTYSLSVTAIDQPPHPTSSTLVVGPYVYAGGPSSSSLSPSTSTQSDYNTLSPPRNSNHHHHSASQSRLTKKGDVFGEVMNWNFHPNSTSGSISNLGIRRDRNNSSASSISYMSPSSVSSQSSSASVGIGIGEFGELTAGSVVRLQRSGSTATDSSYPKSEMGHLPGAFSSSQQLIVKPFGNHVTFEPRWRPKPSRGRRRKSSNNGSLSPQDTNAVGTKSSGSEPSAYGVGDPINRNEERRRKSQSWSGVGAEVPEDDLYVSNVGRGTSIGISNINTGYVSDAHSDVDGEQEGREEFELWSAYFDTHITGGTSSPARGGEQAVPEVLIERGSGSNGVGKGVLEKGKEEGEEGEESDFSEFLRVGASAILRTKPSLDSVMTARQGRSSSDNLRDAAARSVGKVDEGEEADREDFTIDDDSDDDEISDAETPPRPPSAIRVRRREDLQKEVQQDMPKVDVDASADVEKGDSSAATSTVLDSQTLLVPSNHDDQLPHTPRPLSTNPPPLPTQPHPTTSMHSRFSTDVFDVLQMYRGLPLLDRLEKRKRARDVFSEEDEDGDDDADDGEDEWVIRLSLEDDESAAPRNDPRFVIWGEVHGNDEDEDDIVAHSNISQAGAAGSNASRASSLSVDGGSESAGRRPRGGSMSKRKAMKEIKKKEKEARSRSGSGTAGAGAVEGIPLPVTTPASSTFTVTPSDNPEPTLTTSTHLSAPPHQPEGTEKKKKQILAATIERWLAQVTSEYNYDELLIFFLTYRTYISPVDLAHLFICRFHWALTDDTSGLAGAGTEDRVKRIVRLRTFVALQYWITTFFSVDFLHNRELRVLMASWLNAMVKDPILGKYPDAMSIVKKLRKVAKECKRMFVPLSPSKSKSSAQQEEGAEGAPARSPTNPSNFLPISDPAETSLGKEHLLGEKFAEAARELKKQRTSEDSDVDLDFLPDTSSTSNGSKGLHITTTGLPLSSLSILQRTNLAPSPSTTDMDSLIETSQALPVHRNLLSKVIGSVGRWKRVLNSHRSMSRMTAYGGYSGEGVGLAAIGMSMMELRSHGNRNMWQVQGGIESYLRVIDQNPPPQRDAIGDAPAMSTSRNTMNVTTPSTSLEVTAEESQPSASSAATTTSFEEAEPAPPLPNEDADHELSTVPPASELDTMSLSSRTSFISIAHTSSTESFGELLSANRASAMFPAFHSPRQFDVVSIDELSDSSSNEEPGLPPGLGPQHLQHQNRTPRRLPTRRLMEVNNDDRSTVSSMGIISRDSYASTTTASSTTSSVVVDDAGQGLGKGIQQWQLNRLVDSLTDDEEVGDVEDALKRLEGHINPQKQQEKATKVEGWVRTIREKLAAGDYDSDEGPRCEEEDEDEDESAGSTFEQHPNGGDAMNDDIPSIIGPQTEDQGVKQANGGLDPVRAPGPTSPPRTTSDARPAVEDVVPIEILQSRVPGSEVSPLTPNRPSISIKSNFVNPPHHSFVLDTKAVIIAQHFAMIDRDLFCSLGFEEFLAGDWMNCEEIEVLDWKTFMNDCARWRAESRWPERTGALGTIRARFNLVANFTTSEVVLTHPNERIQVFVKLLHVAWRSYHRNSLNTVVAIITGLQSKLVTQAMRRSINRLSKWDARIFRDLKLFIANTNCFQYLREAIERVLDAKPIDSGAHVSSVVNGSATDQPTRGRGNKTMTSGCIPFIGIYLSQLYQHHQLPDLIDPTAPNEVVGIDPTTFSFDSPAHPEVFDALAPLPPSLQLEPLINVQKQRLIAGVVNSCITGQQLANRVRFALTDTDMQKACLELKALDSETLQRVLLSLPG